MSSCDSVLSNTHQASVMPMWRRCGDGFATSSGLWRMEMEARHGWGAEPRALALRWDQELSHESSTPVWGRVWHMTRSTVHTLANCHCPVLRLRLSALRDLYIHPLKEIFYSSHHKIYSFPASIHPLYHPLSIVGAHLSLYLNISMWHLVLKYLLKRI
jgi:hypothetical protein